MSLLVQRIAEKLVVTACELQRRVRISNVARQAHVQGLRPHDFDQPDGLPALILIAESLPRPGKLYPNLTGDSSWDACIILALRNVGPAWRVKSGEMFVQPWLVRLKQRRIRQRSKPANFGR